MCCLVLPLYNIILVTDDTRVIIDDDFYIQTLSITIKELEPSKLHKSACENLLIIIFLSPFC